MLVLAVEKMERGMTPRRNPPITLEAIRGSLELLRTRRRSPVYISTAQQSGCRDEGTTGFLQTAQKCENHRDWMLVLAPEKEFTQEWSEEWSGRNVGRDNIAS